MTLSRRRFLQRSAIATTTLIAAPAVLRTSALGADNPILVGSLHDQSGPIGTSGTPMVYALQLAVDEINAAGGLLGRPLKVIHYDTQSNIQLYSQYAQQLAVKDKVDVVHGGITSASREAVRPTFDRFKVLYFYNTLYEGGVCDRNTFCTGTTPAQTVEKLVPSAMKKSGKKAYIIAADYNYGQITAKWMTKYVKDNGGEVLSTDFFPLDVTNFGSTISKIQAAKPDLILSALVGGNHTAFYRQWTAAGMKSENPDRLDHLRPRQRAVDARCGRERCRSRRLRLFRGADHARLARASSRRSRRRIPTRPISASSRPAPMRASCLGRRREEGGQHRPHEGDRGAGESVSLRRPDRQGLCSTRRPITPRAMPISRR